MNLNLYAMILILLLEASIIFYCLRWNIFKTIAVCLVINLASGMAIAIVQNIVVSKIPNSIWYIYSVQNNFASIMMPMMLVSLIVTILTEFFFIGFFNKNPKTKTNVLKMVIVMNLISAAILSSLMLTYNKPRMSEEFTLVSAANWIEKSEQHLFYIDCLSKDFIDWQIGTPNSTNLFQTNPLIGYRFEATNAPVIVATMTNTICLVNTAKPKSFAESVDNCNLVALAPDKAKLALLNDDSLKILDANNGELLNQLTSAQFSQVDLIDWTADSSAVIVTLKDKTFALDVTETKLNLKPFAAKSKAVVFDGDTYTSRTNVFKYGQQEITVIAKEGLEIKNANETRLLKIEMPTISVYYAGIGYINNGKTFLFQLFSYSREIMALNLETLEVGHVSEGFFAALGPDSNKIMEDSNDSQ